MEMTATVIQVSEWALDNVEDGILAGNVYAAALVQTKGLLDQPQSDTSTVRIGPDRYVSLSNCNGWLATVKLPMLGPFEATVFTAEADLIEAVGEKQAQKMLTY
jgi:hypothetical protein